MQSAQADFVPFQRRFQPLMGNRRRHSFSRTTLTRASAQADIVRVQPGFQSPVDGVAEPASFVRGSDLDAGVTVLGSSFDAHHTHSIIGI